MQGIPNLSLEENNLYRKLRKIFLKTSKLQHLKGKEDMQRKTQVEELSVDGMANVLAGTIDVEASNSAARHGTNFVRLQENTLKNKQFNAIEKRRKRAVERLNDITTKEPINNLS